MRILIVDDHILFREGLASLLTAQPDITIVGEATSVEEAIRLTSELRPDIVLMDFSLPDGTGFDATKPILSLLPETKILFLTVHDDNEFLFQAIRVGAKGYVLKNIPVVHLLRFIRGIQNGEPALAPDMVRRILDEFARLADTPKSIANDIDSLSPREVEVLHHLGGGSSNADIARQLVISENTVKNHIHNILTKLNFQSRTQAARLCT